MENEKLKTRVKDMEQSTRESELKVKNIREENTKLENERDHYKQLYEDLQNEIKTKEELITKDQLEKILRFNQQEQDLPTKLTQVQDIDLEYL